MPPAFKVRGVEISGEWVLDNPMPSSMTKRAFGD
jgi:hypothetical protein